jgi:single-stranded DNA-specific DHH superfamily exonuclease
MLNSRQLEEIKEHLGKAQNPVFFFDNDADGLCSFILLRKYCDKGRGVVIKSYPNLNKSYFRRVEEFKADYIFVLDKPGIDEDFLEEAKKLNIPVVCIDHHDVPKIEGVFYYNTFHESKKNEPVSYLCYSLGKRKEELWLAAIGCITDCYLPDFIDKVRDNNPELVDYPYTNAYDVLYNTQLGKIAMILNFGLKDTTTNVVNLIRFLLSTNDPHKILEENAKTKSFLKRFNEIDNKYKRILENAKKNDEGDMLFFTYSGEISISQYLANELLYNFPKKIIIVAFTSGNIANVSLRWEGDIRTPVIDIIKDIEGATAGGHEHAIGARISTDKLEYFRERLSKELDKK